MSNDYRTGARATRETQIIRFATSPTRRVFVIAGTIIAIAFVPALAVVEKRATFECTRSSGTCVSSVEHFGRTERTTYALRDIEGVRVEEVRAKSGLVRRIHLRTRGGGDTTLNDWTGSDGVIASEQKIDAFLTRQPPPEELHASLEEPVAFASALAFVAFVFGTFLAIAGARAAPLRRLVLDDSAGLAILEQRSFYRWRPRWSMPLPEVRGISIEGTDDAPRIVVDTRDDGRVTIIEDAQARDPAVERARAFLDRG